MERIGGEVRQVLGRFGSAGAMADLVAAWPGAVGETIAANAWPARFARDGTLHVATSSSAWAFELAHLESEIAERLRAAVGRAAPPSLRFAPGRLPEPARAAPKDREKPPLEPTLEEVRQARAWTAEIASEELRKTVEKAARTSLAKASADRAFC
jgi:hypothetical protein